MHEVETENWVWQAFYQGLILHHPCIQTQTREYNRNNKEWIQRCWIRFLYLLHPQYSPMLGTHSSKILRFRPYISSENKHISSENTHILSENTHISSKNTHILSENTHFNRRIHIFHRRLHIFHRRLHIFYRRPHIFYRRPHIFNLRQKKTGLKKSIEPEKPFLRCLLSLFLREWFVELAPGQG